MISPHFPDKETEAQKAEAIADSNHRGPSFQASPLHCPIPQCGGPLGLIPALLFPIYSCSPLQLQLWPVLSRP